MSILLTIIIFSILIITHEYGHFIAARRSGVKVEKFAIGFGPPLLKIRGKETQFLICLIPLGGYVKLAGEERGQCQGLPFEFFSQPLGVRAGIAFFGSFFNIILAFVIFWMIFVFDGVPSGEPVVGQVAKYNFSPKAEFNLSQLEKLKASGVVKELGENEKYAVWNIFNTDSELFAQADFNPLDRKRILGIWRNSLKITPRNEFRAADLKELLERNIVNEKIISWEIENEEKLLSRLKEIGLSNNQTILVVLQNSRLPAYRAGLKEADRILEVNRSKVDNWRQMSNLIRKSKDKLTLKVLRNNTVENIEIIPEKIRVKTAEGEKEISQIGIKAKIIKANIALCFIRASQKLFYSANDIIKGLYSLITRKISFRESVTGPIGISVLTAQVAKIGKLAILFDFLGMLSLVLAIINLLPFPVLDGGHLFFILLEKLRTKPLSQQWENLITHTGLTVLILLMLLVAHNDVKNFFFKQPKLTQEEFLILKDKGVVQELVDDGKYVFWTEVKEENLGLQLAKIETLNKKDVLNIWRNSAKATRFSR